ncbi:DUF305 domain-containing protein [Jatrophihabitans sp. YIM 134969]
MTSTRQRDDLDDVEADDDLEADDLDADDLVRPTRRISLRWWVALIAVIVVAAASALIAVIVVRPSYPGDDSPEAGFARDMQQHHAQAVEMSFIVRDRTDDSATRLLAYDILTTQENQEGQMLGWLQNWGDSQARTAPAMAWMGHDMAGMGDMTGATMPGMATPAQLAKLRTLSGRAAEILFLQLMIAHHKGGVEMAQAILGLTEQPEVVQLANSMMTSQQSEIDLMESMLKQRGATDQVPAH